MNLVQSSSCNKPLDGVFSVFSLFPPAAAAWCLLLSRTWRTFLKCLHSFSALGWSSEQRVACSEQRAACWEPGRHWWQVQNIQPGRKTRSDQKDPDSSAQQEAEKLLANTVTRGILPHLQPDSQPVAAPALRPDPDPGLQSLRAAFGAHYRPNLTLTSA